MFLKFNDLNIKGRIYISREGVNAQASVPKQNKLEFENYVKEIFDYKLLRFNYAITHNRFAFYKLTIKEKKNII